MTNVSKHDSEQEGERDDVEGGRVDLFVHRDGECVYDDLEGSQDAIGPEVGRRGVLVVVDVGQVHLLEDLILFLKDFPGFRDLMHAPGVTKEDRVALSSELVEGLVNVEVVLNDHFEETHLGVLGKVRVATLVVIVVEVVDLDEVGLHL